MRRGPLVFGLSFLAAALCAELGVRVFPLGRQWAEPTIVLEDGTVDPLSRIAWHLERWGEQARPRADVSFHVCYDRPRWDYFDEAGCVLMRSNSIGLRDDEITAKEPGELRILAVGDSFTAGLGVRLEDTWVKDLERRLAAERDTPVRVINGGLAGGGLNAAEYEEWILTEGLALAPDVLVLGFCLNDIHSAVRMALLPPPIERPWLGGASRLVSSLQRRLAERRFERSLAHMPARRRRAGLESLLTRDGTWERTRAAMTRIAAVAETRGVRFVVAVFPMLTRLREGYPYGLFHDTVAGLCTDLGVEFVDLLAPVLDHARTHPELVDEDLWVHPTDQHPNPLVHALFAAGIHQQLLSN